MGSQTSHDGCVTRTLQVPSAARARFDGSSGSFSKMNNSAGDVAMFLKRPAGSAGLQYRAEGASRRASYSRD